MTEAADRRCALIPDVLPRGADRRARGWRAYDCLEQETGGVFEKLAHASGVAGMSLDSQISAHRESAKKLD
jgi:hypothetical protein